MIHRQPPKPSARPGRIIPVDAYPPMMRKSLVSKAIFELRSERLRQHASDILSSSGDALRVAVLQYVDIMEDAAKRGDMENVYAQAHEVRGLAATAGMAELGQIANGLCQYLDTALQDRFGVDGPLVNLYLDAIVRAARAGDEAIAYGGLVATELAQLARKKLGGVKD